MDKVKQIANIITIVVVLCIISIPLLCFQNEPGRISVIENKTVAEKPVLSDYEGIFDRAFVADLEEYISDNIGYKEQAILEHIRIMYTFFDKVSVTNFIEGKESHVFYMTDPIMQTYQGRDKITQEEIEVTRQKFLELDRAVTENGSQLIFMPIPNKEEIYEEYMPDSIRVVSDESMLEQITEDLIANTELVVADTKQVLLEHKGDNELLYYRNTDATHWNHYGMLWGYQQLMQNIQSIDSEISYLTKDDVSIDRVETNTPFLYLTQYETIVETFSGLSDYEYTVTPKNGWNGVMDKFAPEEISLSGDTTSSYFHYHNETVQNGKSLVVYGDSYTWAFMLPMLSESFSDVYFVSYGCTGKDIQELLLCVDPDFIVFEVVARMMSYDNLNYLTDKLTNEMNNRYLNKEAESIATMPVREDGQFAIHFDHAGMEATHTIDLAEVTNGNEVFITGWAAEFIENEPISTGDVYIQIGDTYYPAQRTSRPDLGDILVNAGYTISVPLKQIYGEKAFYIVVTSSDGQARYPATEISFTLPEG